MPSHYYPSTSPIFYILTGPIYTILKLARLNLRSLDSLNISKLRIWAYFNLLTFPNPSSINLCL
ncbi:hypothetical protein CKAH01_00519 [Colletotrichum kahawae]|uniref:Uncharacterized protein n=1 Tax=Colletotrichum kahawae TaxID=34407 RepID=A0AAD9YVA2_COLKA|nr:hypothetical protein CKAH01_00519 [Colletotrichum kahawae]